jgi:hypothetical protein
MNADEKRYAAEYGHRDGEYLFIRDAKHAARFEAGRTCRFGESRAAKAANSARTCAGANVAYRRLGGNRTLRRRSIGLAAQAH